MLTTYYGMFSEIIALNATIILQRAWRECRYNPRYTMCEKVTTRGIKDIAMIYNISITISDEYDEYHNYKIKRKQEEFRNDLEMTRIFLSKYNKIHTKFKKRVILKPRRKCRSVKYKSVEL